MYKNKINILRVVLVGKKEIGKTQFVSRLACDSNNPYYYIPTIGIDSSSKELKLKNKIIKLKIFDTGGDERYISMLRRCYRLSNIFFLFYDPFDRQSFEKIKIEYDCILDVKSRPIVVLIRNKYDSYSKLEKNVEVVSDEEALEFANENGIFYTHLSSCQKYETGINELFSLISNKILSYIAEEEKEREKENEEFLFERKRPCKVKKPIIYLYPKESMDISIQLNIKESKLTTIYPKFNHNDNTWKVFANPNGEIKIKDRLYPYLFWEAESYLINEINEGFIVKGEEAEQFLEEKLKILGLNDKESTDFITFWLPVLLKNKLSLCNFQHKQFFDKFELNINPKPDSIIRIFLFIKKIDSPIEIKEQKLESNERKGFTVVEWGGSNI